MIKLFLAFTIAAHAGWFENLCEGWLVGPDPSQFQNASMEYLTQAYARLFEKSRTQRLSRVEKADMKIIKAEIDSRGHN